MPHSTSRHSARAVRNRERARIARDIHDDLGQTLLALKLELAAFQRQNAPSERLDSMASHIDTAIHSLHDIVHGLQPGDLEAGLEHAIRKQLELISHASGVQHALAFQGSVPDRLPHPQDTIVYRVLQESLANAARHARASTVEVRLGCDGSVLALEVRDDGIGFDPGKHSAGMGLRCMHERAASIGGALSVRSARGRGTSIALLLPLRRDD